MIRLLRSRYARAALAAAALTLAGSVAACAPQTSGSRDDAPAYRPPLA